jgi:phosphopantothenoylcysteine synthetase/decarboxylase
LGQPDLDRGAEHDTLRDPVARRKEFKVRDIAKRTQARAQSGDLFCVGFAAESENLEVNAIAKRERKGVPLLVGNIGPATFGQDDNALLLVDAHGVRELPHASKRQLAIELIADIADQVCRKR